MHEHNHCQHTFKYCSKCDAVFCKSCSREWKVPCQYSHWNTSVTGGNSLLYTTPTYSTGGTVIGYSDSGNSITLTNSPAQTFAMTGNEIVDIGPRPAGHSGH